MNDNKLFTEFPPISTEQWEEVIKADLKGADYDKKLVWKTIEGFDVQPYYRAENLQGKEYLDTNPAEIPYTRGHNKTNNAWDIRQDVEQDDPKAANDIAIYAIKRGVTSLGLSAKAVKSVEDLKILLKDIDLEKIKVNFTKTISFVELVKLFIEYIKIKGYDKEKIKGSLNFDPYAFALKRGFFYDSEESNYEEMANIIRLIRENIPHFDCITVNGSVFYNAGAGIVQQLAFTLSAANDYLHHLTAKGVDAHSVGYRMVFSFATSSNYFMEIAKLRAARLLWSRIMKEYNPKCDTAYRLHIHSESGLSNKTVFDPYVNMLRTTTETMSSAIAGADSISVFPFDVAFSHDSEFSRRIATNQQILLKEESYMDRVVDPSAGAYYIESLTDAIAAKAWEIFKDTEAEGGFVAAIRKGTVQDAIAKTAEQRAKDVAMRKTTILGTNQYPNLMEETKVNELENLKPCGYKSESTDIKTLPFIRFSEPFEELRLATLKSAKCPKVFLLTYGNLAMRKARAGFSTNFFAVAGYTIEEGSGYNDVNEGANAALNSNADIVVLCSSDEEYIDLVAGVMPLLKGKVENIVIAGNPVEQIENFKAQGITDFIHVKTNVLETLQKYNNRLLQK
ncbi:MAG: methylmalonyl-CoA mutase family protein [Bacteroidales bacterium]|jgi:methylmalonyl-CoA mutase|nr:methylmalonyl-CoA mutase family protein [Bacteroidales bacterium]